jgi:hypothetical protein
MPLVHESELRLLLVDGKFDEFNERAGNAPRISRTPRCAPSTCARPTSRTPTCVERICATATCGAWTCEASTSNTPR